STFVMKALARVPPLEGMAAMQSINVVVLNPWFLGTFMGTAVLCIAALLVSVLRWNEPHAVYLLVGAIAYLIGTLGVTRAFNVPRNNALAAISRADPQAPALWSGYISSWTNWNHVRMAAAFVAAALFSIALRF